MVPDPSSNVQWPNSPDGNTDPGTVTVKPVEPLVEPEVACIIVLPAATAVTSPVLLIVAVVVLAELQVTEFVRFWVLLSLYVPMAVNCRSGVLVASEEFAGVTLIKTRTGGVIVRIVELVIDTEAD